MDVRLEAFRSLQPSSEQSSKTQDTATPTRAATLSIRKGFLRGVKDQGPSVSRIAAEDITGQFVLLKHHLVLNSHLFFN